MVVKSLPVEQYGECGKGSISVCVCLSVYGEQLVAGEVNMAVVL